ncbi:MAG: hypothetical protein ACOH2S_23795 [Janthinobacterium svalbardensis]|uniref:hypothetical protein n=1 Tax=Janthinobacterium svalbardensis TaxID=368607 RepID=UPI00142D4B4B|nr:hypothetical protein [Janthinobacterium svalbardensis]
MSTFAVIVRTETERFEFFDDAASSGDVIDAAIDRYGVCGVTAKLKGATQC